MTIKAKLYGASTEWGTGRTRCFLCRDNFEYINFPTVPAVSSNDLCNRPCTPGSHRWNCAALGGDVCFDCADRLRQDPLRHIKEHMETRLRTLRDEMAVIEAWLTVDEFEVTAKRPPGERPECHDVDCGLADKNLIHVDH